MKLVIEIYNYTRSPNKLIQFKYKFSIYYKIYIERPVYNSRHSLEENHQRLCILYLCFQGSDVVKFGGR